MVLPIAIAIIAIVALVVAGGLLLVIFAFLNPWAVVAMFGMVMGVVAYKYGRKGKKSRR